MEIKKILTLFERKFNENGKLIGIENKVPKNLRWVLRGEGEATIKYDGSCCAVIDGQLYRRYDAIKGRKIPVGAIPCQKKPDKITGHFPHWVKCIWGKPADKWYWKALENFTEERFSHCQWSVVEDEHGWEHAMYMPPNGTYEAVGMHFNGNPYKYSIDTLIPHGEDVVSVERTFDGIADYLENNYIEGLVFWKDGEPKCKIKRSDFGFVWNGRE